MDYLRIVIVMQIFFGFAITGYSYALPADARQHVNPFSDVADGLDMESVAADVEENLQRQRDIPVIDIGALVFYSGNILLDLLLNIIFAIPEMIGLLIYGITSFFSVDVVLIATLQAFVAVLVSALYVIGVIQLLTSIRSGRAIV